MSRPTQRCRSRGPRKHRARPGEATLPAVTHKQVFTDARLQTLIDQALVNNRDLMIAAANIAAAREQYRIQRADQLPAVQRRGRRDARAATRTIRSRPTIKPGCRCRASSSTSSAGCAR